LLLDARQLGILNVLAELELAADLVYPLFLVSSADNNERVSKRGDELLKRKANGANLEDMMLIKRLFAIYQGTTSPGGTAQGRVAPAGPTLKARLMAIFLHSVAAANAFPSTLQCVFDCIYGKQLAIKGNKIVVVVQTNSFSICVINTLLSVICFSEC
jgi:proteasome component ECM29